MDTRKSISMKSKKDLNSKMVKPSRYIDMVVEALQTLRDRKGSIPKNITGYIANSYSLTVDKKTMSSSVYRALKQGLDANLIVKNSNGLYKLSAKGKRKIPERRHHRKRRRGRRRGKKKKKGKRRKGRRRRGRKKGRKKKRRRSRHRKSRRGRHRRHEEFEEQSRRKRKKNHSDDD